MNKNVTIMKNNSKNLLNKIKKKDLIWKKL